jgi:F-type H+-transporting ATPase subunit b
MSINLTLILEVISFFILLFLLHKFVFRHILEILEKRRNYVENNLKDIEKLKREIGEKEKEAKSSLEEAKKVALKIKEEAKIWAEEFRSEKGKEIEKEIEKLKEKAEKEVVYEKEKAKEYLKNYSLEIAFFVAQKILKREIDKSKHKEILDDFLKIYEQNPHS